MVERRIVDHVLQILGQVGQLRHVGLLDQFTMSLPHLVLDFISLPALSLVDFQRLVIIVGSAMLLGEVLDRLLDEWEVDPHLGLVHIHMHRLLDDLLLKALLQALGFGSGGHLACRTTST